jgi:hypothetical protein
MEVNINMLGEIEITTYNETESYALKVVVEMLKKRLDNNIMQLNIVYGYKSAHLTIK